jgi:flagellar motor switch protein FliN/FliY
MTSFIDLLKDETTNIIEGLTGHAPKVVFDKEKLVTDDTQIPPPVTLIPIDVVGEHSGKIIILFTVSLATTLSDLMMGGEGEEQQEMSEDDLDAIKEITSDIFSSLSTSIASDKSSPSLSFEIQDAKLESENETNFAGSYKLLVYEVSIASTNAQMILGVDKAFLSNFIVDKKQKEDCNTAAPNANLTPEELRNISLIMDVELPVRVRIGTKSILLKDVLNMDIGSIVELDQLANDPLDILIGDKIIAKGEVVIVDGNFGVQIDKIGSPKERLAQLNNG